MARKPPKHKTSKEVAEIIVAFNAGAEYTELSRRFSITNAGLYKLLRRNGVQLRGKCAGSRHPLWKGGSIVKAGYRLVWVPIGDPMEDMIPPSSKTRHVLEHRLVMARALGRSLRDEETVHHINGDRLDNRIENLQLCQGRHGNAVALCCADCGSRNLVPAKLESSVASPETEEVT